MASYWEKTLNRRIGRRRALIGAGGVAVSAAFLAACGGDDDDGGGGGTGGTGGTGPATSALIHQAEDRSDDAIRGGVFKERIFTDPQNFSLYNFDPFSQPFANVVGSKLVKVQPSRNADPTSIEVIGDAASDWEISGDKLTYTFKLNPNAKYSPFTAFHQGAPASIENRQIDSEDVTYAWSRFLEISSNAGEFANSVNPAAPVVSVEAPDKQTVVMKLNKPYAPLITQLANGSVSYFYIIPKEGANEDADFNNRYQFGGGPFMIKEFEPSVRLVLQRNPNFELVDTELKRPYVDEVEMTVIPDPTAATAQFQAGNVYQTPLGGLTTEEVLRLKSDNPDLLMWATPDSASVTEWFGMGKEGPWKDQRVRQAVQYSWDRDTFIDVFFAVDKLNAAGIPENRRWNTSIPCGGPGSYMFFPGMWLDPQGSEFGENSKYITLGSREDNIAEAKKLLSAAGFADGFDFKHLQYPIFPGQQQPAQDIIEGMMADAGMRVSTQEQIMIPEIFDYIFGGGDFNETLNTVDFGGPDVGAFLNAHFAPTGNLFGGWNPKDTGVDPAGDPTMNELISNVLFEFDNDKRVEIVHDFQRHMAQYFYYSRYPGGATTLSLAWPVVQNWNVFRGGGLSWAYTNEFLDPSKRPLSS